MLLFLLAPPTLRDLSPLRTAWGGAGLAIHTPPSAGTRSALVAGMLWRGALLSRLPLFSFAPELWPRPWGFLRRMSARRSDGVPSRPEPKESSPSTPPHSPPDSLADREQAVRDREAAIDAALEMTFPASDPPAWTS